MAAGVKQEDVNGAAEELLQAGDRPTVEKIRQRLGRGSPNTVAPLLNRWFEALPARLKGGVSDERARVPLPMAKALLEVIKQAERAEQDKLEPARKRLAEAERTVLDRQAELEAAKAELVPQLEELQAELAAVRQELETARAVIEAKNGELVTSRRALEDGLGRSQQMQMQLEQANQAAAEERRSLQEQYAASERRLLLQVDEARTEAKALSARLDSAAREASRSAELHGKALDGLRQEVATALARNKELEAEARERELRLQVLLRAQDESSRQAQSQEAAVADLLAQLRARDQTLRTALAKRLPLLARKRRA